MKDILKSVTFSAKTAHAWVVLPFIFSPITKSDVLPVTPVNDLNTKVGAEGSDVFVDS